VWEGHVAHIGKKKNSSMVEIGKLEWKEQLGRPRCIWEAGMILQKYDGKPQTGFISHGIDTSDRLLWTWQWNFDVHFPSWQTLPYISYKLFAQSSAYLIRFGRCFLL
jgi:hypothetical protein